MRNIEYLEQFFRKHKLSGKVKLKYTNTSKADEYMSDITLEDGTVININDVIFDIESEFPNDVAEKWMKEKEDDVSLVEWIQSNPRTYMSVNFDRSSVIEYQRELELLVDGIKEKIQHMFTLQVDEEDSDYDGSESGE